MSHTDWDLKLPYFLWAYRATPHSTTGYSPFFLLHGREVVTPANENLRPKVPKPTRGPKLIESLKASLRQAYSAVARANRKSYVANKERYDKRAKLRSFEVGSYVYLFKPARKPGLSKKIFSVCSGRYRVTAKLSELNYEILGQSGRKYVVHLRRLKACHGTAGSDYPPAAKWPRRSRQKRDTMFRPDTETDTCPTAILAYQLASDKTLADDSPSTPPASPLASRPATSPPSAGEPDTAERKDPTFLPSDTPRSNRELAIGRSTPPVTRSQTRDNFSE